MKQLSFTMDDEVYDVEIIKKMTTKNTYIRVRDDLTIYVTTNSFVSEREIIKLLNKSKSAIRRMIESKKQKEIFENSFYFLGKKYDIVYIDEDALRFNGDIVYLGRNFNVDKWYRKEALKIFTERFEYNYQRFSRKIPHPSLTIRKMKTRWGVCNTKDVKITLNLDLLKKDMICLDYVINHELAHLIEANHSSRFWKIVEENFPKYKEIRKKLNNY